jgi:hypothetical protein
MKVDFQEIDTIKIKYDLMKVFDFFLDKTKWTYVKKFPDEILIEWIYVKKFPDEILIEARNKHGNPLKSVASIGATKFTFYGSTVIFNCYHVNRYVREYIKKNYPKENPHLDCWKSYDKFMNLLVEIITSSDLLTDNVVMIYY